MPQNPGCLRTHELFQKETYGTLFNHIYPLFRPFMIPMFLMRGCCYLFRSPSNNNALKKIFRG